MWMFDEQAEQYHCHAIKAQVDLIVYFIKLF